MLLQASKDRNYGQILWISSGNEWFYQRGVELGYPCPTMYDNSINTIILASGDVRMATDVYTYTELCQVKTLKGKIFWCIAFTLTDPFEGLPTSAQ
jgi:hypothetical protein